MTLHLLLNLARAYRIHLNFAIVSSNKNETFLRCGSLVEVEDENFVAIKLLLARLLHLRIVNHLSVLGEDGRALSAAFLLFHRRFLLTNFPDGNLAVVTAAQQKFGLFPGGPRDATNRVLVPLSLVTLQQD